MEPLPAGASDADVVALIDRWVARLGHGDYAAAFALTDHLPEFGWTPDLLRDTVAWCGPHDTGRRVTGGRTTVHRWAEPSADGFCGEACSRLAVEGGASEPVATFLLRASPAGLTVHFEGLK